MLSKLNIWKVLTTLSVIGILLALYLFYNYLTKPVLESCYINSSVNCDAVTKGALSTILGIPVSIIGLFGYIGILLSSILRKSKTVLAIVTFGMIFCLYLTIQEIFVLHVICPVCLTCQLVMLLSFVIALTINYYPKFKR